MSNLTRRSSTRLLPLLLTLGACVARPSVPAPGPRLSAEPATLPILAIPVDSLVATGTWRFLKSPRLDSLVATTLRQHPTVAAAAASLRQADALLGARRGATVWPQVDGGLAAQRQRFNPSIIGQDMPAREFSLVTASINARYTFDLFGANRQTLTALRHRVDARRFELESARTELAAALATAAINRAWQADVLSEWVRLETLEAQRDTMIREQFRLGATTEETVAAQTRAHDVARANRLRQARVLAESDHLLAMLSGQRPGTSTTPAFTISDFSPTVPRIDSVASSSLLNRPDIGAADALLRAAHAEYGATVARGYPQLQLSSSTATQALTSGALFGPGSAIYQLMAQLTQPIWQRGLPAERRASLAGFDVAVAHYEQVVLESWRTATDLMTHLQWREQELATLVQSAATTRESFKRSEQQVALGNGSRWNLMVAEQNMTQARIAVRLAELQLLADRIAWYQAVPGSFVSDR